MFFGLLSIALASCGDSGGGHVGAGGTTGGGGGSTSASGSGGSDATSSSVNPVGGTTANGGTVTSATTSSGGTAAQPVTGGTAAIGGNTGGAKGTGGAVGTGGTRVATGGGTVSAGGASTPQTGGTTMGTLGTGGTNTGGVASSIGGTNAGGTPGTGGRGGVSGGGATGLGGVTGTAGRTSTGTGSGTCTASTASSTTVTGSGPHKVTIETNSGAGIKNGTIFRPTDLGEGKKYPIFVWGEGGCSQDGLSNKASMGEIASWGYFVVADGSSAGGGGTAAAFLDYISWAIAENDKSCSAYYQSLDTTKIAADGFSCGGLMAENAAGDPRFTAAGLTSSGLFSADQAVYKKIHTSFKILLGGSVDMAYANGMRDYDQMIALGIPTLLLSKNGANHGGDLGNGKGDFNTVNLAWLNWQLKGDTGATGKGLLMGASCKYCTSSGWEFKTNIP
ncbi:MAG TPA: hypothetical protein VF518_04620 [Polyangia bacterium]